MNITLPSMSKTNIASDLLWTKFHPSRNLGLPLGRRLTLARGAGGQALVFSPPPLCDEIVASLKSFDEPAAFVIPSRFHDWFFPDYFGAFPEAKFIAGKGSVGDHPDWPLTELSPYLPELHGFDVVEVEGVPAVQEHVFFHRATKSLIVADLLYNKVEENHVIEQNGWFTGFLLKLAGTEQPCPSCLWRASIKDNEKFSASLRRMMEFDFQRIIPGHGEVIAGDARHIFKEAFAAWL